MEAGASAATLIAGTISMGFILGALYQHQDALKRLHTLIQTNPYAFYLRHQIYGALRIFKFNENALPSSEPPARMPDIMKYGFPGLDDIRLYSDFILSFDRRNRVAHWVYEHLRAPCVNNKPQNSHVNRRESYFQSDMNVPSDFRVDTEDYWRSGFSRGHLAAAANHRCHQTHCNETFYLTNVAPQVGKGFNNDAWNDLEIYVRDLTEYYGSVHVCTGPLYLPQKQPNGKWSVEYEVIGRNTVAVPTHFFKVIIIESRMPDVKPYLEAYLMPNVAIADGTDLRIFLCGIREIERGAGLKFFDKARGQNFFHTNFRTREEIYRNFR